jgi:hypothetical protein
VQAGAAAPGADIQSLSETYPQQYNPTDTYPARAYTSPRDTSADPSSSEDDSLAQGLAAQDDSSQGFDSSMQDDSSQGFDSAMQDDSSQGFDSSMQDDSSQGFPDSSMQDDSSQGFDSTAQSDYPSQDLDSSAPMGYSAQQDAALDQPQQQPSVTIVQVTRSLDNPGVAEVEVGQNPKGKPLYKTVSGTLMQTSDQWDPGCYNTPSA